MIKNKLYPYIKQYINEYLWGFTKEQIEIGVLNGTISLEKIHLRPDIINNKLDKAEIPLWLKVGRIGKIKVGYSLMNFIGEKPLETVIEDIDLVFSPSYKFIFKNKRNSITDNELRLEYDPITFNFNNILKRKIRIYDGSVLHNKSSNYYYQDKTKLSKIINDLLALCIKFYLIKPYAINVTIINIHIRFEDDELIYQPTANIIALGITVTRIKVSLTAEGILKKNSFSIDELSIYSDNIPSTFIPTNYFFKSLDKQGHIEESYYKTIYRIQFKKLLLNVNKTVFIEVKSIKGTIGIESANKSNMNIFENQETMTMTVYFTLTIDAPLIIHIIPQIVNSLKAIVLFIKDFKILRYLNDFRPLYAPFVNKKSLTAYFLYQDSNDFRLKKKRIVRDWLFYIFWFKQFKKVFESSSYNNERSQIFRNEFNRYMNIVVLSSKEVEMKELNEDIQLIQNDYDVKTYCINPPSDKKNAMTKENQAIDCLIQLKICIKIKQVKVCVYDNMLINYPLAQTQSKHCMIAIDDNIFNCSITKNQCQCVYSLKNVIVETKETFKTSNKEIPKHEDLANLKKERQSKARHQTSYLYSISDNTPTVNMKRKLPHYYLTIPKYNTAHEITAGLKVSPLVEETQAIQKSNIKTFQQQAKNVNRMKILCDTLHINHNPIVAAKNCRIKALNHSQQKTNGSFIMSILNSNEQYSKIKQEKEEEKLHTEASISKAIKEYNSKKNKIINKSTNNSFCLNQSFNQGIEDYNANNILPQNNNNSFLNKSVNQMNNNLNNVDKSLFSIINNKIKQIKDDYPLSLLNISLNEEKEYALKFSCKKQNALKTSDLLSINLGNIRANIFASYLKELLDIINAFNLRLNILNIATNDQTKEMKDKRYFFLMKKYIFNKCLNQLRDNPNELLLKYSNYIKDNVMVALFQEEEISQSEFDLSYFFSYYFSEGIEIDMNYNRIDVLCYNRELAMNDLLSRVKIPPINFKLELTLSNIFVQLFDFEFDISDYDSISETILDIINVFKAKLRKTQKVIEPALTVIKQLAIKEKENKNSYNTRNINNSIMQNNTSTSFAYTKTLSITNKPPPVNVKIITNKDTFNNSTYDSNCYQNRSNTIIKNHPQTRNNNTISNNPSLFKSSDRDSHLISKNTIT